MKFISYIPENLRYEGAENLETLFTKLVGLFEQVLSGQVSSHYEYLKSVDELYTYWDVIRKPYADKVAKLLDPLNLNELVVEPADKGKFLYFLSDIYAIKGTIKAFRWVLKLVGMDAELIRWYEPEYLNYRPRVEPCRSILKIHVGNKPITEGTVQAFHKLVDLLLDVCFTVALWVYVKDLKDDVLVNDLKTFEKPLHYWRDYYASCSMEIIYQGKERIYGAHTFPQSSKRIGSIWNYTIYQIIDLDFKEDKCPTLHTGFYKHLDLTNPQNDHNIAGMIHIIHPVIRYNTTFIKHNGNWKYDNLIKLSQSTFDCLLFKKTITENDYGDIEWPRYSGTKYKVTYFSGSPVLSSYCEKVVTGWNVSFPLIDKYNYTISSNFSLKHSGNVIHGKDVYNLLKDESITYIKDNIQHEEQQTKSIKAIKQEDLFKYPIYNGEYGHKKYESTVIFYDRKAQKEDWKLDFSYKITPEIWTREVYYTHPVSLNINEGFFNVSIKCSEYKFEKCTPLPKLPNRPLKWNHSGCIFHLGDADFKGFLNGLPIEPISHCPNYHNSKILHDSSYIHYFLIKYKHLFVHGEYHKHRYTHKFNHVISHGIYYRHGLKQTFKECSTGLQTIHALNDTIQFKKDYIADYSSTYSSDDLFREPVHDGTQNFNNYESTMIFHSEKVRNEGWKAFINHFTIDKWQEGNYYLKPNELLYNHNTKYKYINPPVKRIILHDNSYFHRDIFHLMYHEYKPSLRYNQNVPHGTYILYNNNKNKSIVDSKEWRVATKINDFVNSKTVSNYNVKSFIKEDLFREPVHDGTQNFNNYESTMIFHSGKVRNEGWKNQTGQTLTDKWQEGNYYLKPNELLYNHNTKYKYINPPVKRIILHDNSYFHRDIFHLMYHEYKPSLRYNQNVPHGTYILYNNNKNKSIVDSKDLITTVDLKESVQFFEEKNIKTNTKFIDKVLKIYQYNGDILHKQAILYRNTIENDSTRLENHLTDEWHYSLYHTYPYDFSPKHNKLLYKHNSNFYSGIITHGKYERYTINKQTIKSNIKNTFSQKLTDQYTWGQLHG